MRTSARTWGALLAGVLALAPAALPRPAAAAEGSWLGVYTQAITPELRDGMNFHGSGVLVTRVVADSPADRAGVRRGDVIVRVGSRDVDSPDDLVGVVRALPAGRAVDLVVVRDDEKRTLSATLEARDDAEDDVVPAPPPRMRSGVPSMPEPPGVSGDDVPEPPDAPEPPAPRMRDRGGDSDFELETPTPSVFAMGRGRLGIRVESLNPDLAGYFGGRDTRGALVLDVTDDSPASRAGIRAGDVITRLGDKSIENAEDLIEAVRSSEGRLTISLVRHGDRQTVQATLEPARRTLRIRGPRAFNRRLDTGLDRDRSEPRKRIYVDGDEMNPQLRKELEQLRKELEQLREELRSMERGKE